MLCYLLSKANALSVAIDDKGSYRRADKYLRDFFSDECAQRKKTRHSRSDSFEFKK